MTITPFDHGQPAGSDQLALALSTASDRSTDGTDGSGQLCNTSEPHQAQLALPSDLPQRMGSGFAAFQKVYGSQDIEVLRHGYLTASLAVIDNQAAVQKVTLLEEQASAQRNSTKQLLNHLSDSQRKTATLLKPLRGYLGLYQSSRVETLADAVDPYEQWKLSVHRCEGLHLQGKAVQIFFFKLHPPTALAGDVKVLYLPDDAVNLMRAGNVVADFATFVLSKVC